MAFGTEISDTGAFCSGAPSDMELGAECWSSGWLRSCSRAGPVAMQIEPCCWAPELGIVVSGVPRGGGGSPREKSHRNHDGIHVRSLMPLGSPNALKLSNGDRFGGSFWVAGPPKT